VSARGEKNKPRLSLFISLFIRRMRKFTFYFSHTSSLKEEQHRKTMEEKEEEEMLLLHLEEQPKLTG